MDSTVSHEASSISVREEPGKEPRLSDGNPVVIGKRATTKAERRVAKAKRLAEVKGRTVTVRLPKLVGTKAKYGKVTPDGIEPIPPKKKKKTKGAIVEEDDAAVRSPNRIDPVRAPKKKRKGTIVTEDDDRSVLPDRPVLPKRPVLPDRPAAKPPRREQNPFGPTGGAPKTMVNDEWQTCLSAWEALLPILGPHYLNKRVWQPFYYDGECLKHVQSLGFKDVVHTNEDFFVKVKDEAFMNSVDFIWDNPPYTSQELKEAVLEALLQSGKPFCVLLPISILHAAFFRTMADTSLIQAIIPRKVMVTKVNLEEEVPFRYLVWMCYRTKLERDLYLL